MLLIDLFFYDILKIEKMLLFSLSFYMRTSTLVKIPVGHAFARVETQQYQAREKPRQGLTSLYGPPLYFHQSKTFAKDTNRLYYSQIVPKATDLRYFLFFKDHEKTAVLSKVFSSLVLFRFFLSESVSEKQEVA